MVNQQTLEGHWNEIKGKLRSKWGQLTNDDVAHFEGDVDRLVGLIQRKTGEARTSIEDYLTELTENGASRVSQMAADVRQGVQHAAERVQETSKQAADYMKHGYEDAQEMVRSRPAESVLVCFGAGVATGLLLGLLARKS